MTPRSPALLFGLLLFLIAADQFCILPLLYPIGQDLGFGVFELCLLVTAYHAAAGAFGLFVGPLVDRRRHGRVFVLGVLLFAGASLLATVVRTFPLFVLVRVLAGLSAGAVGAGITAYIATRVPPAARRAVTQRAMFGALAGLVVAPLACGIVAAAEDWRWIYAFYTAASIPALVWTASRARTMPPPVFRRRLVLARSYLSLVRRVEIGGSLLIMFLFTGAIGGVMAILGLWLFRQWPDLNLFHVTKVFAAGGLGLYVGANLSPRLGAYFGRRQLVVLSSLALALCFFFLFLIDEWVGLVYTAFFFTAMVESIRRGPLQGTLAGRVKTREVPAYTLLKNGAGQAGMAVMVPLMGVLFEADQTLELPVILAMSVTLCTTVAYFFFVGGAKRRAERAEHPS